MLAHTDCDVNWLIHEWFDFWSWYVTSDLEFCRMLCNVSIKHTKIPFWFEQTVDIAYSKRHGVYFRLKTVVTGSGVIISIFTDIFAGFLVTASRFLRTTPSQGRWLPNEGIFWCLGPGSRLLAVNFCSLLGFYWTNFQESALHLGFVK